MVTFSGESYDDKVYDFKGKDAEVIAGSEEVVSKVLNCIRRQRIANKELSDIYAKVAELKKAKDAKGKDEVGEVK